MSKELLGTLAVALEFMSIVPYIIGTVRGTIKPHTFSWLIWLVTMSVGLAAQIFGGAGAGSWVLAASILSCIVVLAIAVRRNGFHGTRLDWMFLIAALSALPLWLLVKSPLPSVLLITVIDVIGYGPTYRKAWHKPREEPVFAWACAFFKFSFSIAAMESYSLVTWLYPGAIAVANGVLCVLLISRRRLLLGQATQREMS